jgi:uncharacterized protein (TIGR03435 family)
MTRKPNNSGSGGSGTGTRDGEYFFETKDRVESLILQSGQPGPGGLTPGSARTRPADGAGLSIPTFARIVAQQAGRLVIDQTNLTGHFDFMLIWSPPTRPAVAAGGAELPPAANPLIIDSVQKKSLRKH